MKINLYILDDHPMVIEGIKATLKDVEDFNIVGCALNGKDFLNDVESLRIDVILLDINLPDYNGIDLCRTVNEEYKKIKVVALSTFSESSIVLEMLSAGALGYLLKNADKNEMINAIKCVNKEEIYLSEEIQKIMALAKVSDIKSPNLTKREKEIIRLLSQGLTTSQIATALFISNLTVETHRRNILKKFDVYNTTSMLKKAFDLKLI